MKPSTQPATFFPDYWEQRARRFAGSGAGLGAVCSFGMPAFYNRAIDLCQRLALRRWLKVRSGTRVLDVGCGVGRWSRLLASRGASVTGIDLSPTMIDEARRRATGSQIRGSCNFFVRDLATLEAGEKFDLVLSVTVLQHIIDPDALREALQRMAAHLDRAGVMIILEAAPRHPTDACDSAIFCARTRNYYTDLFRECGLDLVGTSGVDPAPFRNRLLPKLPGLAPGVRLAALAAATALSLPIDVLFGRALVERSWHAVFVLTHRRAVHEH